MPPASFRSSIVRRTPNESRVVLGSSESMMEFVSDLVGKVALIVTSPPYHNAINYESHATDSSSNYRIRTAIDYSTEYLPMLSRVWEQCWQMLRPGGYLVVNAGTVLDGGFHFPLPQDIVSSEISSKRNWDFIRTIIWFKVTAGVKRAGSVIQHPLPDYWSYNIMTEHIQVLRKPGGKSILNNDVPSEWWQSVWDLAPVPPGQVAHPSPFPEDIPHRLIRMLTNPNDWVLDPFNGAGATTKASFDLGRNSVGFDLSEKYIDYALKRITQNSSVRARQLKISPVHVSNFTPGPSRGQTRHGAGFASKGRK